MKKYLLTILIMALIIPSCLAVVETLGTYKQGNCIPLIQICTTCSYNNISSVYFANYGGEEVLSVETIMTRAGSKYTYNFCNATNIGRYIVTGHGDLAGADSPWNYDFFVSTTGDARGSTLPLFLAIAGMLLFIIAVWIENEWIGFLAGSAFVIDGIYLMIYGLSSINDMYTRTLAFIALGFGLILIIAGGYEAITKGDDGGLFSAIKNTLAPSVNEDDDF